MYALEKEQIEPVPERDKGALDQALERRRPLVRDVVYTQRSRPSTLDAAKKQEILIWKPRAYRSSNEPPA